MVRILLLLFFNLALFCYPTFASEEKQIPGLVCLHQTLLQRLPLRTCAGNECPTILCLEAKTRVNVLYPKAEYQKIGDKSWSHVEVQPENWYDQYTPPIKGYVLSRFICTLSGKPMHEDEGLLQQDWNNNETTGCFTDNIFLNLH